jgi:uncharacterized protein YdeI (YjbR/CyaY-like superfamily)
MILETTRESLSMAMDAQVTKAHSREQRWNAEYAALRELCLGTGLHESLKWGQACYDLENRNVVLIHGFKAYCALLFMKGLLLQDPHGVLVQQTKNVQAARQMRFGSLADIQCQRAVVEACLAQAVALEKAGSEVAMKTVAQFEVPPEFQQRLDDDPALSAAFQALTPGRRKAYGLHGAPFAAPAHGALGDRADVRAHQRLPGLAATR